MKFSTTNLKRAYSPKANSRPQTAAASPTLGASQVHNMQHDPPPILCDELGARANPNLDGFASPNPGFHPMSANSSSNSHEQSPDRVVVQEDSPAKGTRSQDSAELAGRADKKRGLVLEDYRSNCHRSPAVKAHFRTKHPGNPKHASGTVQCRWCNTLMQAGQLSQLHTHLGVGCKPYASCPANAAEWSAFVMVMKDSQIGRNQSVWERMNVMAHSIQGIEMPISPAAKRLRLDMEQSASDCIYSLTNDVSLCRC